jgi:hypothetical protein
LILSAIKRLLKDSLEHPAECVGCGYCCLTAICSWGKENKVTGGCEYLVYDQWRYKCECIPAMREMKGTGCCCSFMNTWRKHTMFRGWHK